MSLLSAVGLTKEFDGLVAVSDVSLQVPEGQVRALIGPNGAGKTTLVSMLSGRLSATAGKVVFDGCDVSNMPAHRRSQLGMAYTFQITSVFPNLTVHENVALSARRRLKSRTDVQSAVQGALEQVGLVDRAELDAGDLSYGHQRLLEIAMGLAQAPRLLILDEPTQGLADGEIAKFNALIRELAGKTTVLLIEHNMDVVMQVADFVTVLDMGQVLFEGVPDDVKASAAVQAAYLGGGDAAA